MKAKVKRVKVHPEAFFRIMQTDTAWRVSKGIPKGARLRGFTVDPYTQELNLFVEHESFDAIDVSTVAPILETEFRKIQ
ncbi:MAG: hypothetical protein HC840_00390 [Leptolyngbyaceae cyanobacterium RM2_2_4]|nr:hypothetical protein [Leptolyngbyaceae cyanobacterium RM2_2_4]